MTMKLLYAAPRLKTLRSPVGLPFLCLGLVLTASCAGDLGDLGDQEGGTDIEATSDTRSSILWAGPDQCMPGSLPTAINSLRSAPGILSRTSAYPVLPLDDFNFLRFHAMSGCHVQGMVELKIGAAIVHNRVTSSNTVFAHLNEPCDQFRRGVSTPARVTRKRGAAYDSSSFLPHSSNVFHPGGMAAVGDYVFVAVDDGTSTGTPEIFVHDHSQVPPRLVTSFTIPGAGAIDSVAAGWDAVAGRFHLLMNQNSKNQLLVSKSNPTALTDFGKPVNFTRPEVMSIGNGRYPGKRSSKLNYQSMALLRQCDGKMFLLGLTNNNYPSCTGNFDSCDESIVDYATYAPDTTRVGAWQTTGELDNPCNGFLDFDICPNFAAAGTAFVRTVDGVTRLIVRASEHWPEGGDLDVLSWVSR